MRIRSALRAGALAACVLACGCGALALSFVYWPPPRAVVEWIAANAIPLTDVEAGRGFDDLRPAGALIGDARIIGLGEATHGSREHFQMKHRLLEYLVAEKEVRVFAMETSLVAARRVNDYVVAGRGDPAEALAGMQFWTWHTEEVLELVRWMRRWNAAHPERVVEFRGFDFQIVAGAEAELRAYLWKVDPSWAGHGWKGEAVLPEGRDVARTELGVATAEGRLDAERERYEGASSRDEWRRARENARVLSESYGMARIPHQGGRFAFRDRNMADHVTRILESLPVTTRMVVWAHNYHVAVDANQMGALLRRQHGRSYVGVGFVFHQGGFQVVGRRNGTWRLYEERLGPAPAGYVSAAFARTGRKLLLLDLRALPQGPIGAWFNSRHLDREAGAMLPFWGPTVATALASRFDAVLYVETTTRARPLTLAPSPTPTPPRRP